jgi:hypothetical protein
MLWKQIEMCERHETLRNDLSVQRQQREQEERRGTFAPDQSIPREATTMHAFAVNDASIPLGRFSAISNAQVVGQGASYPAAGPHQHDPCGTEPPLGFRVDAMFPDNFALEPSADDEAQATGEPTHAPPLAVKRVGSPLSQSGDPATTEGPAPPSASPRGARGLVVGFVSTIAQTEIVAMREPTAAQALYGHLPSAARREVEQRRPPNSVGDAMWPQLSRETKQREAAEQKQQAEQRERSRRMAADLRAMREALR